MLNYFSRNKQESLTKHKFTFQIANDFSKRYAESDKIKNKYNNRVPIICEIHHKDKKNISLDNTKYLVPIDLSVGQFLHIVRKRIKIEPEKALYIFTENYTLSPTSQLIGSLYDNHKNTDGFLYLLISCENTFG